VGRWAWGMRRTASGESSQCKPGSDEALHPPSLDSLKLPQSFNSHAFSLVLCFDNITPRAHKFLAGERHGSTLRSCAALEPDPSNLKKSDSSGVPFQPPE